MKIFNIEVELMGFSGKTYKEVISQRANHLQGAIRQIYQNEPKSTRIVRILGEY